jgi:3-(3-hydroxy-phenyl)propionate hydroxylase
MGEDPARPVTIAADADVTVVGAGPVGMTAAVLLAARGVRVLVLEARRAPSTDPKAISLDDESLRVYQQAEIAEQMLSIIVPGTGTKYFDRDGKPLFQARGPAPYQLGYSFKNPFSQPDLERVLRGVLQDNENVEVRLGATVLDVGTDGDSAEAIVQTDDCIGRLRSRYLIGADGGRSVVRTQLGIEMSGRSYADNWLVVDTLEDQHEERYGMHFGIPARPHVIVPGLGGRCRYEFYLHPGEGEAGQAPPFDLIRTLLEPHRTITPGQIQRAVIYRFNAVNADAWHHGNIFLMGDAAHMMPPFAGQGLNSGIRDAANLCWKIADVLAGRLASATLDSYETERRPHAEASIRLSEKLGRIVMTRSRRLAEARDRLISAALETPEGRDYFEAMRYRPPVKIYAGMVRPGDAPHLVGIPLAQPRVFDTSASRVAMFDTVAGPGWAVAGVGVDPEDWRHAQRIRQLTAATALHISPDDTLPRSLPGIRVLIDVDGALRREFTPYRGRFVLIRPDHVVAAAWDPDTTPQLHSDLAPWFPAAHGTGRQPPASRYVPS